MRSGTAPLLRWPNNVIFPLTRSTRTPSRQSNWMDDSALYSSMKCDARSEAGSACAAPDIANAPIVIADANILLGNLLEPAECDCGCENIMAVRFPLRVYCAAPRRFNHSCARCEFGSNFNAARK